MRDALGDRAAFLVACDHPTPLALRTHSSDPVPFVYWRPGLSPSGATAMSEAEAARSGCLIGAGHVLLPRALDWIGKGAPCRSS